MKSSSARAATPASSRVIDSAGLWLMPPPQRTKSIATSVIALIAWPSWPAPRRQAAHTHHLALDGALELPHEPWRAGRDASSWIGSSSQTSPRRFAMALYFCPCVRDRLQAQLVSRRAYVDGELHLAGDDVDRARPRFNAADRADELRIARGAMRSTASTHSAAAASASRRSVIGTVPACPAVPRMRRVAREKPLIAVTTPIGNPSASSTGPCSMCSST